MSDEHLLNAIKEFTQEQAGRDPNEIEMNSLLEKDLGIYGDDALEFILDFGKKFNVDVSRFMAADYFSAEGYSFRSSKIQKNKELSISQLIKAVKAGRLDDDVINS